MNEEFDKELLKLCDALIELLEANHTPDYLASAACSFQGLYREAKKTRFNLENPTEQ